MLAALGVEFAGGCSLERIVPIPGGSQLIETSTHGRMAADVVIAAAGMASTLPPALGAGPTVDTDELLAVRGLDGVWACGDVAAFPTPGSAASRSRIGTTPGRAATMSRARSWGRARRSSGDPYWFSDIGPLRVQQLGFEPAVCEWSVRDGLHVGRAEDGRAACVLFLNSPHRLNDARRLLAA